MPLGRQAVEPKEKEMCCVRQMADSSSSLSDSDDRETDSDSDSYEQGVRNGAAQKMAARALRAVADYLAFSWDEKFAPTAVAAIRELVRTPTGKEQQLALVRVRKQIDSLSLPLPQQPRNDDKGTKLAFLEQREKHAAALLLRALSGHLRLTRKRVYHAKLLLKLLHCMGKKEEGAANNSEAGNATGSERDKALPTLTVDDSCALQPFAHWDRLAMSDCALAGTILAQTDVYYAKHLPGV